MRDLARHCGVSTATVSRALTGKDYIRKELREQICAAARELGYRPNLVARNLRSNRSTTIGLVVADVQNPYFTRICRAVEDEAMRRGYAVFLCNTDEDPAKEEIYLRHLIDENVAGIILSPTGKSPQSEQMIRSLDLPLVIIDRSLDKLDADMVLIDNKLAAEELAQHLRTHGCRNIVGLFGAHSITGAARAAGFDKAFASENHADVKMRKLFLAPREEEGHRMVTALLHDHDRPDAIFVSNGLVAIGAYRALVENGIHCPDEIAFAAFDDAAWASLVRPSVTVVEQPTYEIGVSATELLLKRIEDPSRAKRQMVLCHRLILRDSCGCHAPQSREKQASTSLTL